MPRKILVATTSLGMPGSTGRRSSRDYGFELLDAAGSLHPDLVCLPEEFAVADRPSGQRGDGAEPIPGPTFDTLAAKARQYQTYVVAGLLERRADQLINTACMIDRRGHLVGQYDKIHPTIDEVASGIVPGDTVKVFETDFGRLGVAICYDIGWPAVWDELGALGAELVVWPSAYGGGFPLQTYAWRNFYHVVSAVWSFHSRIIDVTGQIVASTSRFTGLASAEIDLDKEVFHTDRNAAKLLEMQTRLGNRIALNPLTEEHVFTLQSNDPTLSVAEIVREFELEPFRAYHKRAERIQDEARPMVVAG